MRYFVVDDATGLIQKVGNCAEQDLELQAGPGHSAHEGEANEEGQYFSDGELTARPTMMITQDKTAAGIDEPVLFQGIPAGTVVMVSGDEIQVDDGELVWSSVEPGTHEFVFRNLPHIDHHATVEVSE